MAPSSATLQVVSLLQSKTTKAAAVDGRAAEKRRLLEMLDDPSNPFADRADDDVSAFNADSFRLRLVPPRDL